MERSYGTNLTIYADAQHQAAKDHLSTDTGNTCGEIGKCRDAIYWISGLQHD
jgi:hypothetical protein